MGVPPFGEIPPVIVAVRYVDTAQKTHASVHYQYLAVVAVIDYRRQEKEPERGEIEDLHPGLLQLS